jgi:hypothetical protein
VSTVVHIQYASGGNGRAVMMVTRAGCAARTHRDLCILRRESITTERYCQMQFIGDGVRREQRTSDGYLLSPNRCIADAKMPELSFRISGTLSP